MAGQFNIPGGVDLDVLQEVYNSMAGNTGYKVPRQPIIERPVIGEAIQDFVQRQEQVKQPTKNINLSQRAEQINKAIEDWQAAKSKQTIEGIKRGATATGKAVKGGVNYMKPIAKLGGKVLGVGADISNVGQLIASDDPFDKWAAGVGLAGSALQKASIPLAATGFGAPLAPWVYGAGTAMQFGGAAAPYIKDWVENNNRQQEANRASERQFLEEELRRRGLL